MSFHTTKRRIQPSGRRAALDVEAEAVVVDPGTPGEQHQLRLPGPAPTRPHRLAWVLVGAMLPVGLGGGYLALRQALAPSNGVLVRREGLAGIYRIEVNGQTFLVNSLGGLQKLEPAPAPPVVATPAPASSPSGTPARPAEEAFAAADAPEGALLPRPPGASAATGVLAQYHQYVQEATRRAPTGAAAVEEGVAREGAEPVAASSPAAASMTPAAPSDDKGIGGAVGAPVEGGATSEADPVAPAAPRPSPAASAAPQTAGVMRRQAAWAGLLAAETVVHPELSRSAVAAPSPATGHRDAVPATGPHVDNGLDAMPVPGDAATDPTPAASASPAASAAPVSQAGAHPRIRPHASRSRATPGGAALAPSGGTAPPPRRTIWEVLFGKKTGPVPSHAAPKRNAPLTDEEEEP